MSGPQAGHQAIRTVDQGVVVVLSGFPRRSETFALGELLALADAGALQAVFATRPGDGLPPHDDAARIAPYVTQLPDVDPEAQAAEMLRALGAGRPLGVHGYFAHQPADVAQRAARRLGVPFGFSVHARDGRKVPPDVLRARAQAAACVVTCNHDAQASLDALGIAPTLVPHGVNLRRFAASPWHPRVPLDVLAVGRLVPKKGFDVLLHALAHMSSPWRLRIVGDGPEREALEGLSGALGLRSRVTWHGVATHAELPALYRAAHVVAVPSVVDDAGDRDGLPNVILEALACGRVVVASRVGAIDSAVTDGQTGWLVEPGDAAGLASCLDAVARHPGRAARVAAAGRDVVSSRFEGAACARRFTETLLACYV